MASSNLAPAISSAAGAQLTGRAGDWGELLLVATTVTVEVSIAKLTVRELFRLHNGSVLAAAQLSGAHVPLSISGKVFAWGEFQVVANHLALRIAELA